VFMQQTQSGPPFTLPFAIDVYAGGVKKRYNVWMKDMSDTFSFPAASLPDLINVDGDKMLLCEKEDDKPLSAFIYQYDHAGLYVDRREAVMAAAKQQTQPVALAFLQRALGDRSWRIRSNILSEIDITNDTVKNAMESYLVKEAENDSRKTVKAQAIQLLAKYKNPAYKPLLLKAVYDSSYTVAGAALEALALIDDAAAESVAKQLKKQPAKGALQNALFAYTDENKYDSLSAIFAGLPFGDPKFEMLPSFASFMSRVKDNANFEKGIALIVNFRDNVPQQFRGNTDPYINMSLKDIADKKTAQGMAGQAQFVQSKLPK